MCTVWFRKKACENKTAGICVKIPEGFHGAYWRFDNGKLVLKEDLKKEFEDGVKAQAAELQKELEAQIAESTLKEAKREACIRDVSSDAKMNANKIKNCFKVLFNVE